MHETIALRKEEGALGKTIEVRPNRKSPDAAEDARSPSDAHPTETVAVPNVQIAARRQMAAHPSEAK